MNIERERAAFEWWASDEGESPRATERAGGSYKLAQIQSYWMAWQARAALQSQTMPYAGVTVWVGNKRCSHGVTKDELELSTFDILQAAFDHARRVEGGGE